MPNLFWYILVAVISEAGAAYAIYKKRHVYKVSTFLVFYLFAAGIAWVGEFTVLGLFNAYKYNTGVFGDPWAQNLFGHLIMNTSVYPAAAVVMIAYSFRYGWMIFVSALLVIIEYLFVKFGIYEQHWWRFYMTFVIVFGILLIDKIVFERINEKYTVFVRSVFFYSVALVVLHTPAPILLLLNREHYQIGAVNKLIGNPVLSSILIIFSYHLVEAFLAVLFTCVFKKWFWKFMPFVISTAAQWTFVKLGVLIMDNGWKFIYTLIIYELFILAFILIEKYTMKPGSL